MSKKEYRAVAGIGYKKPEEEIDEKKLEEMRNAPKKITGYAAVYNSLSEDLGGFKEVIDRGAFGKSIDDTENDIRALVDHDSSKIIGRQSAETLEIREDEKGVYVSITPPDTTAGRDIVESITRGDIDGMSVGFSVSGEKYDDDGIRHITEAKLVEVSAVTFPAYKDTEVAYRKLDPEMQNQDSGDEDPSQRNRLLLKHIEILENYEL
jgi:HK97 family phage prohead protease